jgi:polar amino acid transport system permease protein
MTDQPVGDLVVVPRRSPWRLVGAVAMAALAALLATTLITNPRFGWDVVAEYLTTDVILHGALLTIELTVLAMAGGVLLGIALAVMRLSHSPLLSGSAWMFIWFFRGTPLLIQLIFWFNLSALYPQVSVGIPFGPELLSGNVNGLVTPMVAALLGLTLNEAAYMAEVIRGGLLGVDHGQTEAAQALGMRRGRILRRIVLPQAMRMIIPPTANQAISMLKNTSLVSVLGVADLLHSTQIIYSRNFQTIPLLIVAALWYLAITTVLGVPQHYLERHYGKGNVRTANPSPRPIWHVGWRRGREVATLPVLAAERMVP